MKYIRVELHTIKGTTFVYYAKYGTQETLRDATKSGRTFFSFVDNKNNTIIINLKQMENYRIYTY